MTKTFKHTTVSGQELELDRPTGEVGSFFDRVTAVAHDPRTTADELIDLVYGRENPLLDQTIFKDRGSVTVETLENPLHHVMVDWVTRKQQSAGEVDAQPALDAATMTVTEAATQLGISTSAVRQAIQSHKLAAVKRGRGWFLNPAHVDAYRVGNRGPKRDPALELMFGNKRGTSMKVKIPGLRVTAESSGLRPPGAPKDGKYIFGKVDTFQRGAIYTSGGPKKNKIARLIIIEPADVATSFEFKGFYVKGKFKIAEAINDDGEARFRFAHFVPRRSAADLERRRSALLERGRDCGLKPDDLSTIAEWDGDMLSIWPTNSGHPPTGMYTIDIGHMHGVGNMSRQQAEALKQALGRDGVDFSTNSLNADYEERRLGEELEKNEAKRA